MIRSSSGDGAHGPPLIEPRVTRGARCWSSHEAIVDERTNEDTSGAPVRRKSGLRQAISRTAPMDGGLVDIATRAASRPQAE